MDKHFIKAYGISMNHEGGYANCSRDRGGETYCGISRRYHPKWSGWKFIDSIKAEYGFIKTNTVFPELATQVMQFYFDNFWRTNKCDQMPYELAATVFDMAVNHGSGKAIELLQRSLNAANNNRHLWANTQVDGVIGKGTISCVYNAEQNERIKMVNTWLNCLRGAFYVEIMEGDESQEVFAASWASRIRIEMS